MKIGKWLKCRPSVFIVNFEHPSHLFLAFSIGDFEQVINCYGITFTSLYSNFVISSSYLSIYQFTFKSWKAVLQWVFWKTLCIYFMYKF